MTGPDLLATCWTTAGDAMPVPGRSVSPIDLPTRIHQAARAGFTGFGVVHDDLEVYLRDGDLGTLRRILDDDGMEYVELELLTDWWQVDTPARAESDRLLRVLLDASEVLRPFHVKVGPDVTSDAYDLAHWAEQWFRISEAFANVGTVTSLEFLPFSNISTLGRAVELMETAGHPSGGLLIDLWHLMRGAGDQLAELRDVPIRLITGVELDDADAEQVDDAFSDTVLRRRLPGEGAWPVSELIRILHDKGWTGPWGVEILSETYRVRPLEEALPEVVATTLAQFELAGVPVE